MVNIPLNIYILTLLVTIEPHVWWDPHPHIEDVEVMKDTLNGRAEKRCRKHNINTNFWNCKISLEEKNLLPLEPKRKDSIPIQTKFLLRLAEVLVLY